MTDIYLKFHLITDGLILASLFLAATVWAINCGVSKLALMVMDRKAYYALLSEILKQLKHRHD